MAVRLFPFLVMIASCSSPARSPDPGELEVDLALGKEKAEQVCSSCHLQPPPDALTRSEWEFALSVMGLFTAQELGLGDTKLHYRQLQSTSANRRRLKQLEAYLSALELIPAQPLMPDAEWRALRAWYEHEAPESRPPSAEVAPAPASFLEVRPHRYRRPGAFTSLVRIDPASRSFYVGDAGTGGAESAKLVRIGASGEMLSEVPTPEAPLDLTIDPQGVFATTSAIFPDPRKPLPGAYLRLAREGAPETLVSGMIRTANVVRADLDGDGVEELITSGFGSGLLHSGGVFVYRKGSAGAYEQGMQWAFDGVLRVEVLDADGDGHLDIVALAAAAREGVYLLRGPFSDRPAEVVPILQRHPAFGFTFMEPADVDGDGHIDLVVVNGDNTDGDRTNARRPYHGVRILKGDGAGGFQEAFFHHMPGASTATVGDFDGDGRLDIAVAASYPQLTEEPVRSFVLLRQTAPLAFEPLGHPAAEAGRWITIDSGDLDGDGDVDLVLGGFQYDLGANERSEVALAAQERMNKRAPPVLVLENRTIAEP